MTETLEINNKLLLTRMDEVSKFDSTNIVEYAALADSLITTMIKFKGAGLAANQVGKRYRAFAVYVHDYPQVMFNPKLLAHKGNIIVVKEGCLSYPDIFKEKSRFSTVLVNWRNHAGTEYQAELEGIEAIAFQHELNHLNGKDWSD